MDKNKSEKGILHQLEAIKTHGVLYNGTINIQAIIDLIHRLHAENERLTKENAKVIAFNDALYREKAEIQKQVDELKASNEHLDSENTRLVCEMSKLLDEGWDIMDKEAENCYNKGYQQAVKDTAKEIYQKLCGHGTTYVKKWIKEKYEV